MGQDEVSKTGELEEDKTVKQAHDDRLKEEYIQLHSAWRMLNVYNSDDEACQYYLTTYCKILKIAPGLALLIESHCHSTEPANITWKAGFFKVGLTMVMDDRHHQ